MIRPLPEVPDIATAGTGAVVAGPVSGVFPGSPVLLHSYLTLADGLITALK